MSASVLVKGLVSQYPKLHILVQLTRPFAADLGGLDGKPPPPGIGGGGGGPPPAPEGGGGGGGGGGGPGMLCVFEVC